MACAIYWSMRMVQTIFLRFHRAGTSHISCRGVCLRGSISFAISKIVASGRTASSRAPMNFLDSVRCQCTLLCIAHSRHTEDIAASKGGQAHLILVVAWRFSEGRAYPFRSQIVASGRLAFAAVSGCKLLPPSVLFVTVAL